MTTLRVQSGEVIDFHLYGDPLAQQDSSVLVTKQLRSQ